MVIGLRIQPLDLQPVATVPLAHFQRARAEQLAVRIAVERLPAGRIGRSGAHEQPQPLAPKRRHALVEARFVSRGGDAPSVHQRHALAHIGIVHAERRVLERPLRHLVGDDLGIRLAVQQLGRLREARLRSRKHVLVVRCVHRFPFPLRNSWTADEAAAQLDAVRSPLPGSRARRCRCPTSGHRDAGS